MVVDAFVVRAVALPNDEVFVHPVPPPPPEPPALAIETDKINSVKSNKFLIIQ